MTAFDPFSRLRRCTLIALVTVPFLAPSLAGAADGNGDFALEGAALAPCPRFVDAVENDATEVLLYGGYVQGYFTAINQTTADTYDLLTWQSPQQQFGALVGYCKQNPEHRFFRAVAAMAQQLMADRIVDRADVVAIDVPDGRPMLRYPKTLDRVRAKLVAGDYLSADEADGETTAWTEDLAAALSAFQEANALEPTGLPDANTLVVLLY